MKRNENWLRLLVKNFMKQDVTWVEPARGSSVGLPDANLFIGGQSFPVELKTWQWTKYGLRTDMRPAQIRYHVMGAKKGMRTAILFDCVGEKIYLVAGKNCPQRPYDLNNLKDCRFVGHHYDDLKDLYTKVGKILLDEKFWVN